MLKQTKIYLPLVVLIFVFLPQNIFAQDHPNGIVEDAVRFYFADAPVMIDVARCETHFKQYNSDASPYYDASKTYIGVFQISEKIHEAKASALGFNLATLDGNIRYARYLYDASGTNPWKGCVSGPVSVPAAQPAEPAAAAVIQSNFNIGMTNPQILLIQQILNKAGFTLADSGWVLRERNLLFWPAYTIGGAQVPMRSKNRV